MRVPAIVSGLSIIALATGMSQPAEAVTLQRTTVAQGGTACQLSIPTTDTKVRAKATGLRNEGTTSAFVICGLPTPNTFITFFGVSALTIDGVNHVVNCTAVNGPGWSPEYATKSINTGTSTNLPGTTSFSAADFGGTSGDELPDDYISVTCTLPGQASLAAVYATYDEDVGA